MRTLYDGHGFEEIRSGVTFADGIFTTKFATGIVRPVEKRDEGMRYRWLGTDTGNEGIDEETGAVAVRYTGIQAVLYGKGEAVGLNRTSSTGNRGGSVYLGKDVLGSVRSTTGEYGTLEERYEYDAFGKPYKGDLGNGMNLGYTGKPYDAATGLYNYGYRDYKPEAARFTTMDPVRDGSNWFAYVNNDPVNWVDPWGLENAYFIYTYTNSPKDQKMKKFERNSINDDIKYLEKNGLSVTVIESGTKQDINDALNDPESIIVVTSGHGYNPEDLVGIQTSNGGSFTPSDIDITKVSNNLQTVIFENCYQGNNKNDWETALGSNINVIGWNGITTVLETKSFNGLGLFDRQDKNLRDYLEEAVEYKNQGSYNDPSLFDNQDKDIHDSLKDAVKGK
jgi:RHS repeat-associated protein